MISWTRAILTPIAIAAVVCAVGSTIAPLLRRAPATREMIAAALITLIAAELALVPAMFVVVLGPAFISISKNIG